jgi:hypothetical protein
MKLFPLILSLSLFAGCAFGVTIGSAVLYWFAHRHASVHATLKAVLPK